MTALRPWQHFLAVLGIALAPLFLTILALPILLQRSDNLSIDGLVYTGVYLPPILTLLDVLWEGTRYVVARPDEDRAAHRRAIAIAATAFMTSLAIAFLVFVGVACLASL